MSRCYRMRRYGSVVTVTKALIALLTAGLVACQSLPGTSSAQAIKASKAAPALPADSVLFAVQYYRDMDHAIAAGFNIEPELFISLPMLSGRFVGSPFDVGLTALIDDYDAVAMDFAGAAERIERAIASKMPGHQTAGVTVQPADTRFARFGTFAFEPSSGLGLGRTGFIDATDGNFLWLTYFDRACAVRGRQPLPDGTYFDYAVDIPHAGLFWLELRAGADGSEVISVARSSAQPIFGIELPGRGVRTTI